MKIALAWYSPLEYEKIKRASVDPEVWNDTYEEWEQKAQSLMQQTLAGGGQVDKVPMVLEDFNRWLKANKEKNNIAARSRYATSQSHGG